MDGLTGNNWDGVWDWVGHVIDVDMVPWPRSLGFVFVGTR